MASVQSAMVLSYWPVAEGFAAVAVGFGSRVKSDGRGEVGDGGVQLALLAQEDATIAIGFAEGSPDGRIEVGKGGGVVALVPVGKPRLPYSAAQSGSHRIGSVKSAMAAA